MKFQAFPSSHARRLQETVETFWGTKGIVSKLAWGLPKAKSLILQEAPISSSVCFPHSQTTRDMNGAVENPPEMEKLEFNDEHKLFKW